MNNELGNYKEAEKEYQISLYMVPNRMKSRYDLMNLYLQQKDTANAIYWANSILEMPVKIPSQVTRQLQIQTKGLLSRLNTF